MSWFTKISYEAADQNTVLRFIVPGKIAAWFGKEPSTQVLKGSSTGWYFYPSGKRAGTMIDSNAVAAVQRWKWLREEDA